MNDKDKLEIPPFKNRQEEAEFWDTHDPLDFVETGTKPIIYKGNKNAKSIYLGENELHESLNVRFSEKDLEDIRNIAQEKGLGPTTLVRMWAKEKLQEEQSTQHR